MDRGIGVLGPSLAAGGGGGGTVIPKDSRTFFGRISNPVVGSPNAPGKGRTIARPLSSSGTAGGYTTATSAGGGNASKAISSAANTVFGCCGLRGGSHEGAGFGSHVTASGGTVAPRAIPPLSASNGSSGGGLLDGSPQCLLPQAAAVASSFGGAGDQMILNFQQQQQSRSSDPSSPPQFAKPEDFEEMVGDLRRVFIGWLKRTESELRNERDSLTSQRRQFEEERRKAISVFMSEKKAEYEKLQEERRRVESDSIVHLKQVAVEREEARQRISEERDHFEKEKDLWKRQMIMEREKFMSEYDSFEEEKRRIVDANIAVQTMVDLNVGGVIFESSRLTLTQQQGSFLEGLLSGRHRITRDRNGRIFIDRDSELFRSILQFLRDPSLPPHPRDAAESLALCNEANFYGIQFFPFPLVFAVGGHNGVDHMNTLEVLDVSQQCWRPCAPLETPRTYFGSAYLQGRLFAFGGQNFEYKALCHAEAYDILRDTWMSAPGLNIPRRSLCGAPLGTRLFAIGGFDATNILSSVEAYDPRMKNWMEVASLTVPRSSATCSVLGESLYVIGGTTGERLRSVERFDPRANKWESLSNDMINVRSAATSASYLKALYVFGGTDNSQDVHNSVEFFDPSASRWFYCRSMPQPRMDAAAVVASDSIMIAGGQNEDVYNTSLFYRPELDEWQDGPTMLSPRYGHALLAARL